MLQKTCMRNHATTARRARVTLKGIVAASQSPRHGPPAPPARSTVTAPWSQHRTVLPARSFRPRPLRRRERRENRQRQHRVQVCHGRELRPGLRCAADLARNGDHHVVIAGGHLKAERMAKEFGMPAGSYTVMHLDLGSLTSVREFVDAYTRKGYPIDALVCNAAVYLPTDPEPSFTADGYEASVGINHLGHFLLCHLLIDDIAKYKDPRVIIVGSVTGNTNTWRAGSAAGGFGRPPRPGAGLAKGQSG